MNENICHRPDNDPSTPGALRIIAERLKSDDMVEWAVLNGAADEIERLRKHIECYPNPAMYKPEEYEAAFLKWQRSHSYEKENE